MKKFVLVLSICGKNGDIDHPLPVLKDHPSPGGKTTP
jgi:hypothetical protein